MQPDQETSFGGRLVGVASRMAFGLLAIGLMAGGIMWLHARADDEAPVAKRAPLTVVTEPVTLVESYQVKQRYAGRIAPARQTDVAFERPGLITEIMFDEGSIVSAGTVLARLDTRLLEAELDALKAQRTQTEADRALAVRTLDRQQSLAGQGHASQQRLDEARFAVDALAGSLASLDAQIRRLDIDIEKSTLLAPFAGTIAARWRDEGAVIDSGVPIVTVLESGRPEARIGVPPRLARELETGATYDLVTAEGAVAATLASLRPDLAMPTRTVEARFLLTDTAPVPFGDLIRLEWSRNIQRRGAWVPLSALLEGTSGLWTVLTVMESDAGAMVGMEAVEVLHIAEDRAFVQGTLGDGAEVIAEGVNRVTPGQAVAATPRAPSQGDLMARGG